MQQRSKIIYIQLQFIANIIQWCIKFAKPVSININEELQLLKGFINHSCQLL